MLSLGKTRFASELQVRPDDIDMNQHVHASRYLDYVLAARYDQMARCYRMPMEEFLKLGLGWFVRSSYIEYKRPLLLGEWFKVITWIDEVEQPTVKVQFQIIKRESGKLASQGHCCYTMVNLATGRAEPIPDWILEKYCV